LNVLEIDRPAVGVIRWTLNRPDQLNALNAELRASLVHAVEAAEGDKEARVILLTGQGRAFCAGGDVNQMGTRAPVETMQVLQFGRRIVEGLSMLQKPVIAAVNGIASGAGFNLALAADLVVAHPAAWFQQSFVRLGLMPDMGGTYLLSRSIGLARAKEALITARRFSAAEGVELGFVSRILDGDFAVAAVTYATAIAESAPLGVGLTKWLTNRGVEGSLAEALDREALGQALLSGTRDHASAVASFKSKAGLDGTHFEGA